MNEVVAANTRALMAYHKHATPTEAARYVKISQQQMDRILKGQRVRVDTLEKLARGSGLEPYQMLIPDLNPADPQVLRSLSPAEQRLFRALQEARQEAGRGEDT